MRATADNYIIPREGFLVPPAKRESLYEYLLACRGRIAAVRGDYAAFLTPAGDTYAETPMSALLRDVERLAAFLAARGLRGGDVVTAALPVCGQLVALLLAANKLGLVLHPVPPGRACEALLCDLRRTGSRMLFFPAAERERLRAAAAQVLSVACSESDYGAGEAEPTPPVGPYTRYADIIGQPLPPVRTVQGNGTADAVLLQSETDETRLVRLSSYACSLKAYQYYLTDLPHDTRKDHALCVLPCSDGPGFAALFYAVCSGFQPILLPRFDPLRVSAVMRRFRVAELRAAPALLRALFAAPEFKSDGLRHLRMLFCTGGGLGADEIRRFDETLAACGSVARVCLGYGKTETAGAVTSCCWQHFKPGTVGFPLAGVRIQILDARGRALPRGVVGEIAVAGEGLMSGWLADDGAVPADPADVCRFCTGDRGFLDEEGYLVRENA